MGVFVSGTKSKNKVFKRSTTKSSNSKTSMADTVSNYKKRLQSIGVDPEEVTDDRNFIEKALNLEKDQNVLFDIFEVLGRPQNALFTGIKNLQEGESFAKGLKEGITGEEKTTGKDLLTNAGMSDREGKLDLSDVLGFGLDVFADPLDFAVLPVKTASTVGDLAKGAKAFDTASDVAKGAKAFDTASDIAKATEWTWKPASQALVNYAGQAIKGGAKIADKGVSKVLGALDNRQLSKIEKVAQRTGQTTEDIIEQVGGTTNLLDSYNNIKKGLSNMIDSSKAVGGAVGRSRLQAGNSDLANAIASEYSSTLKNQAQDVANTLAERTGRNADDIYNEISENMFRLIESEQDTTIDGAKFLKNLSSKSNKFQGTEESVRNVKNILDNFPNIKYNVSNDGKTLTISTKKSKYLTDFKNNPDVQNLFKNAKLEKDLGYSADQVSELSKIKETFENTPELKELYNTQKNAYNDISKIIKENTGVDFSGITDRSGYLRRSLGDLGKEEAKDVALGRGQGLVDTKSFSGRKWGPAEVANVKKQEEITSSINRTNKTIQSEFKKLSYNKEVALKEQKAAVTSKLEGLKNFDVNLTKTGVKEQKIRQSLQKIKDARNEIATKLDDNIIKKVGQIQDATLSTKLSKTSTNLNNATKEYNDIIKKLSSKDLSSKQIGSLEKRIDSLSSNINKYQTQLDAGIARVKGYADKKTLSLINDSSRAINKAEELSTKNFKLTSKLNETLDKTNLLKQANADNIERLNKTLDNIELQLGAINPENDKKILSKIERLQNKVSILESKQGQDLFKLDFYSGLDDFIDNATFTSKGAQVFNDALLTGTLYDKNYIKFADDLVDGKIPNGFVKVNGTTLSKQLDGVKGLLPENSDAFASLADDFSGKTLYLDKDFANLLNVTGNIKANVNPFVKMINGFNNTFKKFKVLTPGFQVRNFTGNATNMVLSGMPATAIPEYYVKATNVLNDSENILSKVAQGIELTADESANWKVLQQFYQGGFAKAGTKVQDLEDLRKSIKGSNNLINKALEVNANINDGMDKMNRLALLMYANDNPKYIQKLGKSNAIEAVKYALFDPSNMSDFERNVMKKVIPFYTFTKQNLLFQASNLIKNTPKYGRLLRGMNSLYNNLDENSYYQYQKEGFQIPLPWTDGNGNQMFLKANLPVSDLGEWLSNPGSR